MHMLRRRLASVCLVGAVGFAGLPSLSWSETYVDTPTLADLTRAADAVVVARVVAADSEWVGRALYTVVELEVQESVKGESVERVSIRIPGGRASAGVGGIEVTEVSTGAPVLLEGTESVFFLRAASQGPSASAASASSVVGGARGQLPIVRRDGRAWVRTSASEPIPLEALMQTVRELEEDSK